MSLMRYSRAIPTIRVLLDHQRAQVRLFSSSLDDEKTGFATVGISQPAQPTVHRNDTKRKELEEYLGEVQEQHPIESPTNAEAVGEISGVPLEHREERRVRIYRPARNAEQSGWNNTNAWKIEVDVRERWENPLIGWTSSGDPLSNISMNLDFARAEDAVEFCKKAQWPYYVETPVERQIKPKNYGSNFHWNKLLSQMSASIIPDTQRGASEQQTSVQKMLIENGQLIETIAEYQRLGRPADAMRYHELLHKNLLFLGNLVDPLYVQQIQNIRASMVDPNVSTSAPTVTTAAPPQQVSSQQVPPQQAPPHPATQHQFQAPQQPNYSAPLPMNPHQYPTQGAPMHPQQMPHGIPTSQYQYSNGVPPNNLHHPVQAPQP
ncbi:NADH dehydrogenase [ubiquinone] iron-sulfur protein 4, mitochondrial [Aphelenchoides besseyi]|nr:NADH dehydrogenase [ubiquinone] iron-sulfur protein 4, mitochondrial [Aphelenchoides besseyi]